MPRTPVWIAGITFLALCAATLFAMQPSSKPMSETTPAPVETEAPSGKTKSIVVAGGCFWCLEVIFEELIGVTNVESAYVGGKSPTTTYEEVCTGTTGHAEAIKITYDPDKVSAHDLYTIFFTFHNPTTLNQQGPDHGTQYRSAVFYNNDDERALAQRVIDEFTKAKIWGAPIVTTLEPMKNYIKAEDYHQDYYAKYEKASLAEKMGMNAGYCNAIIEPKVRKFREKYAARLKKKN